MLLRVFSNTVMQSAKLRKDIKFVPNQLLAVDKNSQSIMRDSIKPSIEARFQGNHASCKANYLNKNIFKLNITKNRRFGLMDSSKHRSWIKTKICKIQNSESS